MKFSTSPVLKLRVPVWRSRFTMLIILAGFVVLVGRAMYLQGYRNDFLQAKGESRYSRVIEITANRGKIVDRNGEPLARTSSADLRTISSELMPRIAGSVFGK